MWTLALHLAPPLPPHVEMSLPPHGWLRTYVDYARRITDAPEEYHVGVGLNLLSAATCNRSGFPGGPSVTPPVIWTILAGRSGYERKTTSINIGVDLLQRTSGAARLVEGSTSPEGMISQIAKCPTGLVVFREMGSFLQQASRPYSMAMKPLMMELYDAPPRYTRKLSRRVIEIEKPRLCLLGGVAVAFLEQHTTEDDWTGGFFSRAVLIHAKKHRRAKKGLPDVGVMQWLCEVLEAYCTQPIPLCAGFALEAEHLLDQWDVINQQREEFETRSIIQSFYSRLDGVCRKIAYLYALDMGDAGEDEWFIGPEATWRAINFCDGVWVRSFMELASNVALRGDSELLAKVEQTVLQSGPEGCTYAFLMRSARRLKKRVEEALTTLLESEKLYKSDWDGNAIYIHMSYANYAPSMPTEYVSTEQA